jgi:CBS domain containing-hemolysin-like protein
MTGLEITYLVILSVCILASGFFSGSETALVAVPRERVHQLLDTDARARRVEELTAEPDRMLSTLLVANNFVNILGASVATVLFVDLLGSDWGPWVATVAVTSVILVVGEITPKTIATRHPERISLMVAPAIWWLGKVIRPITRFFLGIARGLFWILRIGFDEDRNVVTEEDIRAMATIGERSGDIEAAEREIIHSLFSLADLHVRDVMTPRRDIRALESPVTMTEVREGVAETGHSRFPVIKQGIDQLIGVLYVKDLLGMPSEPTASDINRVLRQPVYVPESKGVLDLLLEMRAGRLTFAVVTDEHGGIEGIVTIKDLVAELVGELQDEYDPDEPVLIAVSDGEWLVDGRTTVEDLEEAVASGFPQGEYTTVAGLVLDLAGRIPQVGDTVECDGHRLEVVRMDRNRVDRVRVTRANG